MDIFTEYAHGGDLPNNGKASSGLAMLNAALLKSKAEPLPGSCGMFGGLLGNTSTQDPLPLSSDYQDYLQKRSDEAKQQRDNQRVIADAIRSGAFNVPPVQSPEVTQLKTSPKLKAKPRTLASSRHDNLRPFVETAIDERIGKNCNTITELTGLVMIYLAGSIGTAGSPVVDEKDGAIVYVDKDGVAHEENFEALRGRIKRRFRTNTGMLEYKGEVKRTLSGRKDATG